MHSFAVIDSKITQRTESFIQEYCVFIKVQRSTQIPGEGPPPTLLYGKNVKVAWPEGCEGWERFLPLVGKIHLAEATSS